MTDTPSVPPELITAMRAAEHITVLTGAGISAESGLDTFRGPDGAWDKVDISAVATPEGFARDPAKVWNWYDARRVNMARAEPNPGHHSLARWAKRAAGFSLITQNIDELHRRAGSPDLIEMHGSIWRVRCSKERACPVRGNDPIKDTRAPLPEIPPRCDCGAYLRPHVVWFGEMLDPDVLIACSQATAAASVFVSAGTSGTVEPAASFIRGAAAQGALTVEVNLDPTPNTALVDYAFHGPAGVILPAIEHAVWGDGANDL